MDVKSFKEYSGTAGISGISQSDTSKKLFPLIKRKDTNRGLKRGDVPLQKALNDGQKAVPIRRTPSQIKQFITIVKKKYKEYGGKDKDLLNSFTERLEQKMLESFKKDVLTETRNPFKYDHSLYARDKDTAPRKPSWTRIPAEKMLVRGGRAPKELLDLFANKMNQSNKSDKESLEYAVKKGDKQSMLINSFKESIEEIEENLKDWQNNHADIIKNEKKFSRTGEVDIPYDGGKLTVRKSVLRLYAIFMKSSKLDKGKKSTAEFAMNSGSRLKIDSILDTVLGWASDKLR